MLKSPFGDGNGGNNGDGGGGRKGGGFGGGLAAAAAAAGRGEGGGKKICQTLCLCQREKNLGAPIRIGQEIQCFPYAGF